MSRASARPRSMVLTLLLAVACSRAPAPSGGPVATQVGGAPGLPWDGAPVPVPLAAAPPAVDPSVAAPVPLVAARLDEVQHIIQDGAAPSRLAKVVSEYTGEPAALVARKTALAALRATRERPVRLAALLDAGHAPGMKPDDDPLWPDLVEALAETWAVENTAGGRRRMLREKDPRTRLLLVSSLAVYAGSNRGLSDMTIPQRRVLRGELMSLYPTLPPLPRQQIDSFVARINVNARGTL